MLTVAVLGPVEVRRAGQRLSVPAGKTTEVLVRLALDAGRPVRADRLIEDLWADAPGVGRNTLQSKISQLRRALGEPTLVTSGSSGYTLVLGGSCVDAIRVVSLATAVSQARRTGDPSAALDLATEARALFRGDVLVDAGEGDWLQPHRVRLEEVRLGLLEDQLAARVDLGAGGDVVGELEALVDRYPFREDLWASLIKALYRTGRQADALATYARVRRALIDQLGVEPGPQLRALENQILQQSPALTAAAGATARISSVASPGNLPALSSPLVGRADELDTVHRLLKDQRLVTLVGPAGVGKTRLAIEVGREHHPPGGVWLVRLDALDAGAPVVQTVAETLHVQGGERALAERFAGAQAVLVLDNCEHVIDTASNLVSLVLDASPELRILATSQLPLGLDGEALFPLEPLPLADATALFISRARRIRPLLALDDQAARTVADVCLSLDGLPLAIELAAARVKSLSVQEIARRLDDRFTLLRDPNSRQPTRRRALGAAIGWSYELLFPDDQRGLWALSCFSGGAPLPAVEHVAVAIGVPEPAVIDTIDRLVDRSLVQAENDSAGAVRYRLLDSIRAYARDRMREAGLSDDASGAHAAWYAEAADRCAATVRGHGQSDCVAFVRTERANIDAALSWSCRHHPLLGVRIANGFGWTTVVLGDGVAGASRIRSAMDAAPTVPPQDRAIGLLLAGWLEASAGNVDRAEADLKEALALADQLSDDRLRADARRHRAFLRIQQGRPQEVLEEAVASLDEYRRMEQDWEVAASLLLATYGSIMLGDSAGAGRTANEAVELLTPIEDAWGLLHARAMIGAIAQAQGNFEGAAAALSQAVIESEQLGFTGQTALHLATLGRVEQQAGDAGAAVDTLDRAIRAATDCGDLRLAATARLTLARTLRGLEQHGAASALLEENQRWYDRSGGGVGALLTRCLLAATQSPGGDAGALQLILDEARSSNDHETEVYALDALAVVAARRGERRLARARLDEADDLARPMRYTVNDSDRIDGRLARELLHC